MSVACADTVCLFVCLRREVDLVRLPEVGTVLDVCVNKNTKPALLL